MRHLSRSLAVAALFSWCLTCSDDGNPADAPQGQPVAPEGVDAAIAAVTDSGVVVSWTRSTAGDFQCYVVTVRPLLDSVDTPPACTLFSARDTCWYVGGLRPATRYAFVVSVVDSDGLHAEGQPVEAVTRGNADNSSRVVVDSFAVGDVVYGGDAGVVIKQVSDGDTVALRAWVGEGDSTDVAWRCGNGAFVYPAVDSSRVLYVMGSVSVDTVVFATSSAAGERARSTVVFVRTPSSGSAVNLSMQLSHVGVVCGPVDTVHLVVHAHDSDGEPLRAASYRVARICSTNAGAVSVDSIDGVTDSVGSAAVALEGADGEARMRVVVTVCGEYDSAVASARIRIWSRAYLKLVADKGEIDADGISTATVTAVVSNDIGHPIVDDTVLFRSTSGTITARAVSDTLGRATAVLVSERRNIEAVVRARRAVDSLRYDSTTVVFSGVHIDVSVSTDTIHANGRDTIWLDAVVRDAAGVALIGEPFTVHAHHGSATVWTDDWLTGVNGRARSMVISTGTGADTLYVVCGGALVRIPVWYISGNALTVDSLPDHMPADGAGSSRVVLRYLQSDSATPISGASVSALVRYADGDTVLLGSVETGLDGRAAFEVPNPSVAGTAQLVVTARSGDDSVSVTAPLQFTAGRPYVLRVSASPVNVTVGGDTAIISATVFDSLRNPVGGADVRFALLSTLGGGEKLAASSEMTNDSGIARTKFVSGDSAGGVDAVSVGATLLPSAGESWSPLADTVFLTVGGAPFSVSLSVNEQRIEDTGGGTLCMPLAALVTDRNGNPVPDGTEVSFTGKLSGYVVWYPTVEWGWAGADLGYYWNYWALIDSASEVVPFEDLNGNFVLDDGEDRNYDGRLNRGEDYNGDGVYCPGPAFEDINGNGVRDQWPEPHRFFKRWETWEVVDSATGDTTYANRLVDDTAWADFNRNGWLDSVEPLRSPLMRDTMSWEEYKALEATAPGGRFDRDFDNNGVADPSTAVTVARSATTVGGTAENAVIYLPKDVGRVEVTITARCGGVASPPLIFVLPENE